MCIVNFLHRNESTPFVKLTNNVTFECMSGHCYVVNKCLGLNSRIYLLMTARITGFAFEAIVGCFSNIRNIGSLVSAIICEDDIYRLDIFEVPFVVINTVYSLGSSEFVTGPCVAITTPAVDISSSPSRRFLEINGKQCALFYGNSFAIGSLNGSTVNQVGSECIATGSSGSPLVAAEFLIVYEILNCHTITIENCCRESNSSVCIDSLGRIVECNGRL